jgi:hypothetical protein
MVVHSTPMDALEGDRQACLPRETLPIEAGDAEWDADLFDTMCAGDLDAVVKHLRQRTRLVRKAAKARRMLAMVDPRVLGEGLVLHRARMGVAQ